MSTKLGKYYICDRCGITSFFEKIEEGETDGGFTRFDKFEAAKSIIYSCRNSLTIGEETSTVVDK